MPNMGPGVKEVSAAIADAEKRLLPLIAKVIEDFINQVKRAILGNSGPYQVPNMAFFPPIAPYVAAVQRTIFPLIDDIVHQQAAAISALPDVSYQSYIGQYMDQAGQNLTAFPQQVGQEISDTLTQGLQAGEGTAELRKRVTNVIDDKSNWQWRAERIARTQATSAVNAGTLAAGNVMQDVEGTALFKVWLATDDARVRPTHHAADKQTVALATPFTVGGVPMMMPGDPAAPPNEVINCRCALGFTDDETEFLTAGGYMSELITDQVNHQIPDHVEAVLASIDIEDASSCDASGCVCSCGNEGDNGDGLVEVAPEEEIVAALPTASDTRPWDHSAAQSRILKWANGDPAKLKQAFLYQDPNGNPAVAATYKFPIADVIAGVLTLIPRAVYAAAGRLNQAKISAAEKAAIASRIDGLYKQLGTPSPLKADIGMDNTDNTYTPADGDTVHLSDSDYDGKVISTAADGTVTVQVQVPPDALEAPEDNTDTAGVDTFDLAQIQEGLRAAISSGMQDGLLAAIKARDALTARDELMRAGRLRKDAGSK